MFPILGIPNKDGEPGLIGISGKAGVGKDTLGNCLLYTSPSPRD